MEPYYTSWQQSSHKDVSCIKCHFPPGVGEKVRGKVLGLVQLAKYVTQTQGPRPTAEIPDESCLRSGCHETRLLSGRVDYKGIAFDHAKHLPQGEGQLTRGMELRCTSCHSQIVQGEHMTVTESTCFLCHFKDVPSQRRPGSLHPLPSDPHGGIRLGWRREVPSRPGLREGRRLRELPRRSDPRQWRSAAWSAARSATTGKTICSGLEDKDFMHKTHVTDHKVDCMSCHLTLNHSLDPHKIATAASQCAACHPNQHQQQVAMLEGSGARLIPPHPSNMTAARIACFTCHQQKEVSPTGTVLLKASLATCVGCHAPAEIDGLKAYHEQLKELLTGLEAGGRNAFRRRSRRPRSNRRTLTSLAAAPARCAARCPLPACGQRHPQQPLRQRVGHQVAGRNDGDVHAVADRRARRRAPREAGPCCRVPPASSDPTGKE